MPLALLFVGAGACSLLNVPEDVRTGGGNNGGGGGCSADSECPPPASNEVCKVPVCDTTTGKCSIAVASDGVACDDLEPCTTGETCTRGVCAGSTPTNCSASDTECSKGKCVKGIGCDRDAINQGLPCDAMNPCAQSTCNAGKCTVDPGTVTPGDVCDDGLFCTKGDSCNDSGKCVGNQPTCTATVACKDAVCDEAAKMCTETQIADGAPCEDGMACTGGETCSNQMCTGGTKAKVVFFDDFSTKKAWTLGPEWAIGPAKASVDDMTGNGADPAEDHSGTTDNNVAGVVLGGTAAVMVHPMSFFESPAIDATAASGKLFLSYYRWLDSDIAPFMTNVVEVNDGMAWHEVFRTDDQTPILDSPAANPPGKGWTFVSHDITQFKNAALRVRFGFDVGDPGVFIVGSWNLDDVKVQNAPCPN